VSLLAVGLSHRSAPHALLERAALSTERTGKLVADLAASPNVHEAAALATCNRIEVYAGVEKFHAAVTEITELLSLHTGVEPAELTQHLYVHYDNRAVQHLFTVACGLDSMVVGEPQILGQIRTALATAQDHGTAGRALNDAIQQALRVGKRAHSETGLDRAGQSVVSVALDAAYQALGVDGPNDLRVLIIGAGSMAALAAASLNRAGVRHMVVANRTHKRAEHLASQHNGVAVPMDALLVSENGHSVPALGEADLVVACTGAPGYVITGEMLNRAAHSHPVALVDLALPRDVDPAVRELSGVHVIDLERVAQDGSAQAAGAAQEIAAVRDLVLGEVEAYAAAQRAEAVAPTVAALRVMAADVVRSELDRLRGKTPALSEKDRAEVEQTVRRVVDKLLHVPTVRVKQLAGAPGGSSYAEALRELFGLDPASVEAVSAANAAGTTNEVSA
jgi:glutamyl-tRNA reductase